jgi:AcrR family transcriptional regulator
MPVESGLREKKSLAVKQAFFDAAMQLFKEKGYGSTSVDEIAERAGFSRATYFNHFGSKKGVLRFYGQRLQARAESLFVHGDPSSSPLDRIRELLLAMAREADSHCEELKLIYLYSHTDPEHLGRPTPARMKIFELVHALVSEAQREGQVRRDMSSKVLAFHISSVYQSAVLASLSGFCQVESAVEAGWKFILNGVHGGHSPPE